MVVSLSMAFLEMALFLLQKHPREEEMAPDDARRGFMMRQIFHLFLLTSLFSLDVFNLFLLRNNKICISVPTVVLKTCIVAVLESIQLA